MQFEYQHKAGEERASLIFNRHISAQFYNSLSQSLKRIGGRCYGNVLSGWTVPSFVNSIVIAQIIHNTCYVCGGLMQDGEAIKNDDLYHENSGNTTVWPNSGEPKTLQVRKCSSCGHSHT